MGSEGHEVGRSGAHWLHFALLLGVVGTFEAGRMLVSSSGPFVPSLLIQYLYLWIPALAGIAISISSPGARITRDGIRLGALAALLMVGLDVAGSALRPGMRESAGLFPNASVARMGEITEAAAVSWVRVGLDWLKGDITGVDQLNPGIYSLDHPRLRVVEAFSEAGLILTLFAAIALVISATSWIRVHVIFKQPESRRTSQIVLAWLMTPLLTSISRGLAADQRFFLLFNGGAVWRPLVPSAIILLVGVFAWWYTARYRESEE